VVVVAGGGSGAPGVGGEKKTEGSERSFDGGRRRSLHTHTHEGIRIQRFVVGPRRGF
jgi:hypothetical protein